MRYLSATAHFVRIAFVILALADVSLSCASEPAPTAVPTTTEMTATSGPGTAVQLSTPVPTWTQVPTWTPEPTWTLEPSPTQLPTATQIPTPTPTPYPTATSYPTPTHRPVSTPTPTPLPFRGEWGTTASSVFDDRVTEIVLSSTRGSVPSLLIRCRQSKLQFYVIFLSRRDDPPSGFLSSITVSYRIDDEPTESLQWTLSTDGRAAFLPAGKISSTIRRLYSADEFEVKTGRITAMFHTAGLYWAVKPVLEACEVEVD